MPDVGEKPQKLKLVIGKNVTNDSGGSEDIENIKDPLEKLLAKHLKVVAIKGKRRRTVPILFTYKMQQVMNLIIQLQNAVGVHKDNDCQTRASLTH